MERTKPEALSAGCAQQLQEMAGPVGTSLRDTFWKDGKRFLSEDEVDKYVLRRTLFDFGSLISAGV
jgi:hypothetical protein